MARRPKTKTEAFIDLTISTLTGFFSGWMFMLAVGVVHHEWIPACPTIGYWWSVVLASLVRSALYQLDQRSDDKICRLAAR